MARCQYCQNLSISDLVALAEEDFVAHHFPQHSYYQHHGSFYELEASATGGCDLCQLIVESFKGVSYDGCSTLAVADRGSNDSIYEAAKDLDNSNIRISIGTTHLYSGEEGLQAVGALDTLLIQAGEYGPDGYELMPVLLKMISPRGMLAL